MKALIISSVILFFTYSQLDPFDPFLKSIPSNWTYKVLDENNILISKNDSIEIYYCGYGSCSYEDTFKIAYHIQIEKTDRISNREIKRRTSIQDSLLRILKKNYRREPDKSNAYELISFRLNANLIDSLRIPFYSSGKYSYFHKNNSRYGHCYVNDSIRKEVETTTLRVIKRK